MFTIITYGYGAASTTIKYRTILAKAVTLSRVTITNYSHIHVVKDHRVEVAFEVVLILETSSSTRSSRLKNNIVLEARIWNWIRIANAIVCKL